LTLASCVSAAMILAAPLMGQIRAALRFAFPREFVTIVGGFVAVAIVTAILLALTIIRAHRPARYAAIALALGVGAGYSLLSRSGLPEVDWVERVHFIEYGGIALLFYRVWRPVGDPSIFILPMLAGLLVGTLDEWLQWFVPARVGEMRDVLLDLIAVGCGLLVAWALQPPESFTRRLQHTSVSRVGVTAAAALLVFAAFFSTVHLGYLLTDSEIGSFRSRYSLGRLDALARDRGERWRTNPPLVLRRFSREDQYMEEGLWHVRRRNEDWKAGDYLRAWNENRILEKFFAPVLDTPSYATPRGSRWPPDQRADAERRIAGKSAPFLSDAEPLPILAWSKRIFWLVTGLAVFAIALTSSRRTA
jgi:hypothetical protein